MTAIPIFMNFGLIFGNFRSMLGKSLDMMTSFLNFDFNHGNTSLS
jgi:hypothetical protein